jgi:hypothetical protein
MMAAAILALCTAVSAAVRPHTGAPADLDIAAHLADLDDVAVLMLATIAVPVIGGVLNPGFALGIGFLAAILIAVSGSLLFVRARTTPERGVFVIGAVVLLGGASAYAGVSPLTTGCIAGVLWTRSQTQTQALVESELRKLQHPLVAILLIIAGASIQVSALLLWVAAPLVLVRFMGKLIGSLVLSRWFSLPPALVAIVLVPPGVLGIALVLNFQQVLRTGDALLLSAVTVATAFSELLALMLWTREDAN